MRYRHEQHLEIRFHRFAEEKMKKIASMDRMVARTKLSKKKLRRGKVIKNELYKTSGYKMCSLAEVKNIK